MLYMYFALRVSRNFSRIFSPSDSHHFCSFVFLWVLKYSWYFFFVFLDIVQSSSGISIVFSTPFASNILVLIRCIQILFQLSRLWSLRTIPFEGYSTNPIAELLQYLSIFLSRWYVSQFPVSSWADIFCILKYSSSFLKPSLAS